MLQFYRPWGHGRWRKPNPTSSTITVRITGYENTEHSKLEVYEMVGKLVTEKAVSTEFSSVDLSKQKSGNYILRIFINDKMKEWKVVKAD